MKEWVRRANGLPGRTVTGDTYLAEEEKEATITPPPPNYTHHYYTEGSW